VGKSRVAVTNTLRLLKATDAVKEALLNGRIGEGHARALLALEDPEAQVAALRMVMRQGLTVRQTENWWGGFCRPGPSDRPPGPPPPEVQALEDRFRQALGTRVHVRPGKKGGRIIIYYYSEEELEGLYQRLVAQD
jgi:ParB family chromosome partitioning protein